VTRNRQLIAWTWAVFVALNTVSTVPVLAAKVADESESPALRKPLPALVAPVASEEDDAVFSTEVPLPPPFDPTYQPPPPASVKENTP
jgi:hypothetical protein